MDTARQQRKEEISKALIFIQSPLAYPDPEGYQDFLTNLICNLLEEGNTLFREGEWEQAVKEFSEGLNVSQYAGTEEIQIPKALLDSLYVNRATAFYSMGLYDQGVEDCDKALGVCMENCKALYRKALCLKELGKHKEAYNCTTDCLLISRLDKQVNDLAQDLAVHLGLKNRKPYVSAKILNDHVGNGMDPQNGSSPTMPLSLSPTIAQTGLQSGASVHDSMMDTLDDCELMGDELDSLLDSFSTEPEPVETCFQAGFSVPHSTSASVLPAPTPQLPPAFFNSSVTQLNSPGTFLGSGCDTVTVTLDTLDKLSTTTNQDALEDFPSGVEGGADVSNFGFTPMTLDDLDDILDTIPNVVEGPKSKTKMDSKPQSRVDSLETFSSLSPPSGDVSKSGVNAGNNLDSLDTLDSFPSEEAPLPPVSVLDSRANLKPAGIKDSHIAATSAPIPRSPKTKNNERNNHAPTTVSHPLSYTHEFRQACSACFPWEGGLYTCVHKPDLVHSCKRDVLLCRLKASSSSEWTRVRPMPRVTFTAPYALCKELQTKGVCKYRENCTFAYNHFEIDVWTLERKGKLDRNLLFTSSPIKSDPVKRIICLLQDHKGMFIFLCQACYDRKPTIISKRSTDNHTICSNEDTRHKFDINKCLAFVLNNPSVRYRKIRPLNTVCIFDLCHQNIQYKCLKGDNCLFAHSDIELKTWRVQRETGIKHDDIVKISTNYYEKQEQNSTRQKGNKISTGGGGSKAEGGGGGGAEKSLDMRMRFICAQCWRDGLMSDPDKALKNCTAKAKHKWTKDRRVLLVMSSERSKWIMVRPLPHSKNFPMQYDICTQIVEKGKCKYIGNCTFAHSPEEKKMWMWMKNNGLVDMQQVYDLWLSLSAYNRQPDGTMPTQSIPEEKCIIMPTDYAEPMSGFHCRLCGRHSNSQRQWQQHISSEKHKDRVFSCDGEDEALSWSYRFPARSFELCHKLDAGDCPDGVSCDYAHSLEELQEWIERRDLLRDKLAKAREDMLIMPDESDFGKYNFLLQD